MEHAINVAAGHFTLTKSPLGRKKLRDTDDPDSDGDEDVIDKVDDWADLRNAVGKALNLIKQVTFLSQFQVSMCKEQFIISHGT
jgi:hypothetical protein